jgi:hypothetical protein
MQIMPCGQLSALESQAKYAPSPVTALPPDAPASLFVEPLPAFAVLPALPRLQLRASDFDLRRVLRLLASSVTRSIARIRSM